MIYINFTIFWLIFLCSDLVFVALNSNPDKEEAAIIRVIYAIIMWAISCFIVWVSNG